MKALVRGVRWHGVVVGRAGGLKLLLRGRRHGSLVGEAWILGGVAGNFGRESRWHGALVRKGRRHGAFTEEDADWMSPEKALPLQELDRSGSAVSPLRFLSQMRALFPQFAQQTQGHYMQQDAEECWSQLLYVFREQLKVSALSWICIFATGVCHCHRRNA